MNARATGRAVAIVVALCVLALLGVAWILTPRHTTGQNPGAGIDSEPPPSIPAPGDATIIDPSATGVNIEELVKEGGRGQWTGRLSSGGAPYRFTYEHLEPRDEGVIELDAPVLWLAGDDRSVVIRAGSARMRRPRGEREPTDGRISGGVVADIYSSRVENDEDARTADRLARVSFESLIFERDRLLVRTDDDVRIVGRGIDALLRGVSASLSEDEAPLRLLRVLNGGHLNLQPDLIDRKDDEPSASRDESGNAEVPGDTTTDAGDAAAVFYELVLNDSVRMEGGGANISSASFRAVAALIDGALPEDAIARFDPVEAEEEHASGVGSNPRPQSNEPEMPRTIAVAWEGTLELKPIEERPGELRDESLHIAFDANDNAPVRFNEATLGVEGEARTVAYGATTRSIALAGGGAPDGVRIVMPDSGEFVGTALKMNLTSGVASAEGPHVVRALGRAAGASDPRGAGDEPIQIASSGRADVLLDTRLGPLGSGAPVYPRSLVYSDGVEARRGGALVRGASIRASFTDASNPVPGSLAGVSIADNARAQDERGSWIEGDTIDILFAPDPARGDRPAPFSARARGAIHAGTTDAALEAGSLEADIAQNESGDSEIGRFTIKDDVIVTLADGTVATGGLITGDARTKQIDLDGAPARIVREDDGGSASLEAESFALDGVARTLSVAGPGKARATSGDGNEFSRTVDVTWDRSLRYDDAHGVDGDGGRAEVAGAVDVRAEERFASRSGTRGVRTHHATGDRVMLDLGSGGDEEDTRALLRALIEGLAENEDQWARVESRVYALDDDDDARRLLGVLFVTGPLMDAQPGAQTVAVAGPGRLLVDNRIDESRDDDASIIGANPGALGSSRGTSLFEWTQRLDLDALGGTARMRGGVSFRHLDPTSGVVTDLRADDLRAGFDTDDGTQRASLREVTATGSVVVRHGTLQIVCDAARYDARSGETLARGDGGRRVTILDTASGRQDEAGAIRLNLETGAWSVEDPSAFTVPIP